jgi:hypothetical protein
MLEEDNLNNSDLETIYSVLKNKIDMLFDTLKREIL